VAQDTLEQSFDGPATEGLLRREDAAAARRTLRSQIAKLERDLADTLITCFDHASVDLAAAVADPGVLGRTVAPRLLSLSELERQRDDLARRVVVARRLLSERATEHERNRVRLERMLLEPGRHRFERIANRDLGLGGCGVWQVRPRLGPIGMLAGWWEVKLSSGCPLARPSSGGRAIRGRRVGRRTAPGAARAPEPPVAVPVSPRTPRAACAGEPPRR
jgi:hypothetical protein